MKELTRAEEELMQYLWQLKEAKVADIIELMPEPKPAYNTVSTIIRILEQKDFVGYRKEGRGHIYFPKVAQEVYKNASMKKLINNYFGGSFSSMVSFFVKKNDMSITELEKLKEELDQNQN